MRKFKQRFGFLLLRLSILLAVIFLFSLIIVIIVKGAGVISIPFLTEFPKDGMTKGGIFPAIMGTFLLAVGAILFALPLGVLAAIYLREYAKSYRVVRIIRVGVNNLAGVPSIPQEFLKKMMEAPDKKNAGVLVAADFLQDLIQLGDGVVLLALGWSEKLPEILDLIER